MTKDCFEQKKFFQVYHEDFRRFQRSVSSTNDDEIPIATETSLQYLVNYLTDDGTLNSSETGIQCLMHFLVLETFIYTYTG